MECIFSQYPCKFPRTTVPDDFYKELYEHEQDMQERILQAMANSIDWFCNPLKLLQQAVRNLKPNTNLVPKNHIYVRHATITPSRVILYKPLLMKSSRLLRHFDPEKFLKVSFRDENMRFLPGKEYKLLSRVFRTLEKGLRVADRRYMFLGCSSSMLRSHSCWMTSLDPSEVRSWIGDFHDISCVGKYMARVGLGMSSTDETITVEDEEVDNPSPDVKQGNFCFSDGIGTISSLTLRRVLECLQPKETHWLDTVTAIQIRVAGYKGVLALDPTLTSADTQCRFRESMRKFPSSHRKLEVVNTSTSHPLSLNRQGIVLLSCLGVQDSTFERLQEKQLQELLELFSEDQSVKAITRNCRALKLQPLLRAGMDIRTEPFLQQILSAVYFQKVQNLVTKTHIFVPDGRLLMGVLDETNSLDYGEIFVQICDSATNWKPQIVTGRCATYKNPCFHPGDVRVLRARDIEKLRHLVNCVVFPAKGPRPHTNEMSGSDLDGDLYTVIWMPELIPADMHDPMLFDEEPPLEVSEVRETDMFAFFVKVIESAELSLIANSHLAFSDSKPDGARDPDCIELAKLHAKAVDFPKTGQQVVVRKDLLPTKFPDFMEKPKRPSYPSQKVIGRLYRRAKCLFGDDLKRHVNVRLQPDSQLMFEGYIGHSDESKETYRDYCTLLRGLMQCYGVEQEAEIVTGCIVSMHDHLTSELFQWTQVVKQQFQELVQTFRNRFFDSVSCPEQRYSLASAWYMVAYTDDDENMRCLSFPWVISDVLAEIKHNKLGEGMVFMKDRVIHGQSLEEAVYHSMRADFIEQQPSKFASLLERRDLLEKVEVCVRARFKNASVKMFGSSCNFLFEPSVSDVDICVEVENVPAKRLSQIQVLDKLLPCLRQDFPGTCAMKDAVVPILKNDSGTLAFDITADGSGLRKSEMVLRYMSSHPSLLLVLTVLVKWARNVGLIASSSMGQFTPFTMAWLFIQFCLEEGYVPYIAFEEAQIRTRSSSYSTLNSVIEEVLDPVHNSQKGFVGGQLPGEVLLAFFRHYADLSTKSLSGATSSSPFRLPNPLEESKRPCVDLNLESFTVFRNRCLQAWHALTRTRNVKALYVLAQLHVCLRLSRFQSAVIRGAEEFYAQRLRSLTDGKASVRISPLSNSKASGTSERSRSGILLVEILGDPAAVQQIDQALRDLNNGRCWLPTTEHRVFVKGASFLLFEGSLSDQDRVGFVKYWGQAHLQHVYADLHVPVLVAKVGSSTWQAHAFSRLRSSLWRQRQCLLRSDSMSSATPVTALVRFGTLYVTNVPFDLGEQQSIGSVSIAELEDYTIRGKKYLHPDNISARYSSKPAEVETKRGPAAGDHPGKEEDYGEVDQDFHHHQNARGPERRKKPKESRPGASQSLFPHVS
ncbi:hypothetical protein Mapa_004766 [Marchantia paleacea]|nr:hypothetical protein Mapa_004766 [Marchantia paleacea]